MTLPGVAPLPKNAAPYFCTAMPRPRNSRAAVIGESPWIVPGFITFLTCVMSREVNVVPGALLLVNVTRLTPSSPVTNAGVMSVGSSGVRLSTRPELSRRVAT